MRGQVNGGAERAIETRVRTGVLARPGRAKLGRLSFPTNHRNSIARYADVCVQKVMRKILVSMAYILALVLWPLAACGNTQAQTGKTGASKTAGSHAALSCTKDAECRSGQRCGFTLGCRSKGKCIVPSRTSHCIDPGGRCGCDGRPVDIFCGAGSGTEYTSAPTNAVGPCPKTCSEQLECGSDLVCHKGFCVKP